MRMSNWAYGRYALINLLLYITYVSIQIGSGNGPMAGGKLAVLIACARRVHTLR